MLDHEPVQWSRQPFNLLNKNMPHSATRDWPLSSAARLVGINRDYGSYLKSEENVIVQ